MLEQFCSRIGTLLKAKFSWVRENSHNIKAPNSKRWKSAASGEGRIQQAETINNNHYNTIQMPVAKEKTLDMATLPPELHLSILGGNIFTPDNVNEQILTGIALNIRIWNTGAPSFVSSWSLMVIPHEAIPILAQSTRIPEILRVNGVYNNAEICASDALDLKVKATSVETTPVEGTLLFYVKLPKKIVLGINTKLELIATDMYEKKTRKLQRMGDWLQR